MNLLLFNLLFILVICSYLITQSLSAKRSNKNDANPSPTRPDRLAGRIGISEDRVLEILQNGVGAGSNNLFTLTTAVRLIQPHVRLRLSATELTEELLTAHIIIININYSMVDVLKRTLSKVVTAQYLINEIIKSKEKWLTHPENYDIITTRGNQFRLRDRQPQQATNSVLPSTSTAPHQTTSSVLPSTSAAPQHAASSVLPSTSAATASAASLQREKSRSYPDLSTACDDGGELSEQEYEELRVAVEEEFGDYNAEVIKQVLKAVIALVKSERRQIVTKLNGLIVCRPGYGKTYFCQKLAEFLKLRVPNLRRYSSQRFLAQNYRNHTHFNDELGRHGIRIIDETRYILADPLKQASILEHTSNDAPPPTPPLPTGDITSSAVTSPPKPATAVTLIVVYPGDASSFYSFDEGVNRRFHFLIRLEHITLETFAKIFLSKLKKLGIAHTLTISSLVELPAFKLGCEKYGLGLDFKIWPDILFAQGILGDAQLANIINEAVEMDTSIMNISGTEAASFSTAASSEATSPSTKHSDTSDEETSSPAVPNTTSPNTPEKSESENSETDSHNSDSDNSPGELDEAESSDDN